MAPSLECSNNAASVECGPSTCISMPVASETPSVTVADQTATPHRPSRSVRSHRASRSRQNANSTRSHNDFLSSDLLFFDANTFKQVKRLYCGMLMVAMAYSVTMIIMMMVLYKTLPETIHSLEPFQATAQVAPPGNGRPILTFHNDPENINNASPTASANNQVIGTAGNVAADKPFAHLRGREPARAYLDQIIAINFLTAILYLLAFYAAHRELYTLTLAFTSTLAFTMMFSVIKIFVEGVHFPNNFMSLLLRVSIVFVALVYLGQLRRKQQFIRSANSFWLSSSSFLGHPALRSSRITPSQTAQLIRDFLASSTVANSSANKTDEDLVREYQDQPPNYEEALRCPPPSVLEIQCHMMQRNAAPAASRTSSHSTLPPPPFEEVNSGPVTLTPSCVSIPLVVANSSTSDSNAILPPPAPSQTLPEIKSQTEPSQS